MGRPADADHLLPLWFAQRRLWFLDQVAGDVPASTIALARRLRGPLDLPRLRAAVAAVVARHDSLRTTVRAHDGEPYQVVAPDGTGTAGFEVADAADGPLAAHPDLAVRSFVDERIARPFRLDRGPLLRTAVGRVGPEDHVLLFTAHQVVADEWSLTLLCDEVGAHYNAASAGCPPEPAPLPVPYPDAVARLAGLLSDGAADRGVAWWRRHLAGAPALLTLPADRPRPAVAQLSGAVARRSLPARFGRDLTATAATLGATPFMVVLAAYATTLGRFSGQTDVVVGCAVAGRGEPWTERLIGCFGNLLPLRCDLSGDRHGNQHGNRHGDQHGDPTFGTVVSRVCDATLGGLAHGDVPVELLVEELRPDRPAGHAPLFQAQLVMRTVPAPRLNLRGVAETPVPADPAGTTTDVTLDVEPYADGGLAVALRYRTDLFDAASADHLLDRFLAVLRDGVADPTRPLSGLAVPGEVEQQVVAAFNATRWPVPDAVTGVDLIEPADPDATAVVCGDVRWSYAELTARVNRLAHALRAAGTGPDVVVALCLDRTGDLVALPLAVWRAGGAYLPLDPALPTDRLREEVARSGARVLVVGAKRHASLLADFDGPTLDPGCPAITAYPATPPEPPGVTGGHLAYVGRPAGREYTVALPHRAVVNYLAAVAEILDLSTDDRFGALTPLWSDRSIAELVAPLLAGAATVVVDSADGAELRRRVVTDGVTALQLAPATWQSLLAGGGVPAQVRLRLCGDSPPAALTPDLAADLLKGPGDPVLWNVYGPTETTGWAIATVVEPSPARVLVGPPLSNVRVHVVDERMRPAPVGVVGEVCVGGTGVGRGYPGRPGLTAARFRPDPFSTEPGARCFLTGDRARMRRDGRVEFVGHPDDPAPRRPPDPTAVLRPDRLTPAQPFPYSPYKTPAAHGALTSRHPPLAPRNPVETLVAGVWADVLGVAGIDVDDDFFAIGGHSLHVAKVVARIRAVLGVGLRVSDLLAAPTVAGLARRVENLLVADIAEQTTVHSGPGRAATRRIE